VNAIKEDINSIESDNLNENNKASLTIWRLLAYFIIFSLLGFIIEVIYCAVTWGIVQVRQTFLYLPLCTIYGTGAVFVILLLKRFKKSKFAVFLLGFFVGSIVEYSLSLFGEVVFNMRWWDYYHEPFNLNGRIALKYSLFWGFLSLLIIFFVTPLIDRVLNYLKLKLGLKKLTISIFAISIFIFLDFLIALFALNMFMTRLIRTYGFPLQYSETTLTFCTRVI
jgi:uncharacterized membrane protein